MSADLTLKRYEVNICEADVQKSQQVDDVIKQTLRKFGSIDILVNNVGGLPGIDHKIPYWEMSEELWDTVIRLNTKPIFLCSKAVSKVMTLAKIERPWCVQARQ